MPYGAAKSLLNFWCEFNSEILRRPFVYLNVTRKYEILNKFSNTFKRSLGLNCTNSERFSEIRYVMTIRVSYVFA